MSDAQSENENVASLTDVYFLYRTVSPHQFEKRTGKPRPTAFHLRQEPALSVWDARYVTPRRLLENYLDGVKRNVSSEDEAKRTKAENRLNANGATPEQMYEKGWRIIRISEQAFSELALPVGLPCEEADLYGHRDVTGTHQDFEDSAIALVEASEVLSEKETLE